MLGCTSAYSIPNLNADAALSVEDGPSVVCGRPTSDLRRVLVVVTRMVKSARKEAVGQRKTFRAAKCTRKHHSEFTTVPLFQSFANSSTPFLEPLNVPRETLCHCDLKETKV